MSTKGKSCDTFGPIGPWLVTKDEVPGPQNLPVSLKRQWRDDAETARRRQSSMGWPIILDCLVGSSPFIRATYQHRHAAWCRHGHDAAVTLGLAMLFELGIKGLGHRSNMSRWIPDDACAVQHQF